MVKFKPFLSKFSFPNFKHNFKLGALLLTLTFLLNYQPSLTYPPKKNIVYAQIQQEQTVQSQASPLTFQLPHPGYITTHFSNYHPGIDLCSGLGMPVKSIAKGKIVESGFNFFGLGLVVEVEHEGGYRSLYAHLGKIFVKKGTEVDVNDYLGEIGMTGHTSGPHTHLEISKDGRKIDPLAILPEIRKYPQEEDFVTVKSATPSAVAIPANPQPTASASAQIEYTPNLFEEITPAGKSETLPKLDLNQQNLNNLLNITQPLQASPLTQTSVKVPQGGKLSLNSFLLSRLIH